MLARTTARNEPVKIKLMNIASHSNFEMIVNILPVLQHMQSTLP
jgi:hypothetical protein